MIPPNLSADPPMFRCSDCRFGKYDNQTAHIICHRFPPQWGAAAPGDGYHEKRGGTFRFPTMAVDQWCGEYRHNLGRAS